MATEGELPKATKAYLKQVKAIKAHLEEQLKQETKPALMTPEERAAAKESGKGGLYGIKKEVPVTEEDREKYRRMIEFNDSEITRVEAELAKKKK